MWSYIKKAINSNLAKPLDEKMDENRNPNSPQLANFKIAAGSISLGTFYTVCDVTGSGILNKVVCYYTATLGHENNKIRITIDGDAELFEPGDTFRSLGEGDLDAIIFNTFTDFKTSLKVEVEAGVNTGELTGTANYSLRT